jgi:hypothetical protein
MTAKLSNVVRHARAHLAWLMCSPRCRGGQAIGAALRLRR